MIAAPDESRSPTAVDGAALRAALEWVPEPAILVDGNRIEFANGAASRLFGKPATALVGASPGELFLPDMLGDTEPVLDAVEGIALPARSEKTLARADGTARRVETTSTPVGDATRFIRLILMHDITDFTRAQGLLRSSEADLRRLAAGLDSAREQERQRIARELHDELQQSLAAIEFELGAMGEGPRASHAELARTLDRANLLTRAAMKSAQRIINDLQPLILEELGLVAALEAMVAQFGRRTGMQCLFRTRGIDGDSPPTGALSRVATCFYRVTHEALLNIAQHARASRVDVLLAHEPGGRLRLRIRDNGVGLGAQARQDTAALGLLGMQERLRAIGGALMLSDAGARGTTVQALVPAGTAARPGAPSATAPPRGVQPIDAHSNLLEFLYRVPVGLLQASMEGRVEIMNPMAARMLLPLARNDDLTNLFVVLRRQVPQLRRWVGDCTTPSGKVCDRLALDVPAGPNSPSRVLSLDLSKLDSERLVAVIMDLAGSPARRGAGAEQADVRNFPNVDQES